MKIDNPRALLLAALITLGVIAVVALIVYLSFKSPRVLAAIFVVAVVALFFLAIYHELK